jgi:hypothetical protein
VRRGNFCKFVAVTAASKVREEETTLAKRVTSCRKMGWLLLIQSTLIVWLNPCRAETENRVDLRENWTLQSSCNVDAPAEVLSTKGFSQDGWYKATVPSTVLASSRRQGRLGQSGRLQHQLDCRADQPGQICARILTVFPTNWPDDSQCC